MWLSPSDVRELGLQIMKIRVGRKSQQRLVLEFHKHCGSSPLDLADMWHDLCNNHQKNELSEKEKSEKGFTRFLAAHFYLWARPKNAAMFASRFGFCEDYCRGRHLWKWIGRIADLADKKIKWPKSLDAANTRIYGITTDGVDFKCWEKQDKQYPFDPKNMSHKFNACGAKYIIALSVYEPKCVFIEGPFRGGLGDFDMFKESGLMRKLKKSRKICIADGGFRSTLTEEREMFALPNKMDSKELNNFKSRARLRQETYNRRLKHFDALSETWKLSWEKHGIALRAVAVTVQYQMDNGSPIYCV